MAVPPPNYIVQLKHMLLTGNRPSSFPEGVHFVKLVDRFTMEEKQFKRKNKLMLSTQELRARFYAETDLVANLVRDSKHVEVLECLKEAINKRGNCWQAVASCLVAVVRGEDVTKECASAGYAALPALLRHSTMLFFFLQVLKIADEANKAGWGRGLKTAVRRWYASWTPHELLLELWHRPRGYGWSHKDVMKMGHLNQNALPLGSRVVVQWYFSNLDRTKVTFAKEQEAMMFVRLLDMLYNKQNKRDIAAKQLEALLELDGDGFYRLVKTQDPLLSRQEELPNVVAKLDGPGVARAVQDRSVLQLVAPRRRGTPTPPPLEEEGKEAAPAGDKNAKAAEEQSPPQDAEPSPLVKLVSSALEDRLREPNVAETVSAIIAGIAMNNFNRRVKCCVENTVGHRIWRGGVPEKPEPALLEGKDQKPWQFILPAHLDPVQQQLDCVILAAAKRASIAPNHVKLMVVFEPCGGVKSFVNTEIGFNVHKQIRGTQAVAISMFSLCFSDTDRFGDRANLLVGGRLNPYQPPTGDFRTVTHSLESVGPQVLKQSLPEFSSFVDQGKEELVFFFHSISPEQLDATCTYLKDTPVGSGLTKVVLVGLFHSASSLEIEGDCIDPRLLVLNGFSFRSVDVIQAFLEDEY